MTRPPAVPGSVAGPWTGGTLSQRVRCVLAGNPGPMTLDGTNTYLLSEPGSPLAAVVDPGPDDPAHRRAVLDALDAHGRRAAIVLLTHSHPDHADGARALAGEARCPVRAVDPAHRIGPDGMADGETIEVGGLTVRVVSTPGHTSDSVSLLLPAENALLTGDTVLGRGTSVIAHPDGRLRAYLESLARLDALAQTRPGLWLLPGHGPPGAPVATVVATYRAHRAARLDEVVAAVAAGARDVAGVVEHVYADVDRSLWPAARLSVRAQVDYLLDVGRLVQGVDGVRVSARDA